MKRRLRDLTVDELRGRRALVRVDYNVPMGDDGEVADPTRIRASFPSLRHLLEGGARPVLMSHLGRPGGRPRPDLSLAPVARVLERSLECPVRLLGGPDEQAERATREGEPGTLFLLENVRFLEGETSNDPEVARALARLGDFYVNDAFGACHRSHASTVGAARLLRPAAMGLLVEAELEALDALRSDPEHPFVVAFGGAKISDKFGLLERMLARADRVLVGGAMANTLLRAAGRSLGRSLVEEEVLDAAARLLERADERLLLPEDLVVAPDPESGGEARAVEVDEVPADAMALDIGPRTRDRFAEVVASCRTLFWNGPMGYFEQEAFAGGTRTLARASARAAAGGAFTVVGGGDSARAVREAGVADRLSHVSTGGGAALTYLEAGTLPALDALEDVDEDDEEGAT